jgi:formate-dependent nitrite reductase membrane component NrfD
MVLVNGLKITNLTDLVPWGLWITIDLSSIALAGGAFSLCALVYLIGQKRYAPIARTATWVGLIGYSMAMLCLFMDIGRPFKFYQAMIYWNTHSLLWEVTMCIILYFTVLLLESLPIIANLGWLKNKFPRLTSKMSHVHHFAPYLAIAGLALSSMHQASLGGAYGVLKARPFWYKPGMPVMFTLTAIIGGVAMTLFVSMLAARLTDKAKVNDGLIERLSKFVGWGLVGYFYWRFWDTLSMTYTYEPGRTEGLHLLTTGPLGTLDYHRPVVHCAGRWRLFPVRFSLSDRTETLCSNCTHSHMGWVDRLQHGYALPVHGHWPPLQVLPGHDVLEHAFPAMGSDHVHHSVLHSAGAGVSSYPRQPGMAEE